MHKNTLLLLFLLVLNVVSSQIKLTQNVGDELINPSVGTCSEPEQWARAFTLEEYGISATDEFQINSGSIGVRASVGQQNAYLQFNIYSIDSGFPGTFSESNLIGSSQKEFFPFVSILSPQIVTVDFDTPVTVPANVERILIEVEKTDGTGIGVMNILIAGTEEGGNAAWYKGCLGYYTYTSTDIAPLPRPNANLYITANGIISNNTFQYNNVCFGDNTEFSLHFDEEIDTVLWDFGDSTTSNVLNPTHVYGAVGVYDVSVAIQTINNPVPKVINKQLEILERPNANKVPDLISCVDTFGSGFSSSFDTSNLESLISNSQENIVLTYFDGNGNELPSPLPNPFSNSIPNKETITVRVANQNALNCYSETSFDLIVNPIPDLSVVSDLFMCSNDTNGFAIFDLEQVQNEILGSSMATSVSFYRANENQIQGPLNAVENLIINEEEITVRAFESVNNCYNETKFKLKVNSLPIAYDVNVLIGCDDNGDGISEYFDTSTVESQIVSEQTGLLVSYFDTSGNALPSPLPNPYTNSIANEETITVRVTNTQTYCYEETPLVLRTSSQPQLNIPSPIYACDTGNGFASFDLSHIESEIINGQIGINLSYFDANGVQLPNPLTKTYENSISWNETITVRAENSLNALCFTETSFELVVMELPITQLEPSYFLCHLEPSLTIQVENVFESYNWLYEGDDIISDNHEAELINAGSYTLTIGKTTNGVYCENSFDFKFIRSSPPTITQVNYQELSNNNFIEIIAIGDGDFEYSLDGINFNDSNYFTNVIGGVYTVLVRDKNSCGKDSEMVTIIDYPKFFTPNNDGINDYWQIYGIDQFQNSYTYIYDRYGKLVAQLAPNVKGWNGLFNGRPMISSDYWFKTFLGNGSVFSGHFSLKR